MSQANTISPYGDKCGFCATPVPLEATVCTGCGAHKGTVAEVGGMLGRFSAWAYTFGCFYLIVGWAALAPWKGELSSDYLTPNDYECFQSLMDGKTGKPTQWDYVLLPGRCKSISGLQNKLQTSLDSIRPLHPKLDLKIDPNVPP